MRPAPKHPTLVVTASAVATLLLAGATAGSAGAATPPPSTRLLFQGGTEYTVPAPVNIRNQLVCDVDGATATADDVDRPVVFDGLGTWLLTDETGSRTVSFGRRGDRALCGDWDGDGEDEIGVLRGNNQYFLAGDNVDGGGDVTALVFGSRSDGNVLTGDWDGDGVDELAVRRGNQYLFATENVSGGGEVLTSRFGKGTDDAVAADVAGQGYDTLALQRGALSTPSSIVYLTTDQPGGPLSPSRSFGFGRPGDTLIAGDVDGDGQDELGVQRTS